MSVIIEKIAPAVQLGEGPHWDAKSQKLYYVDLLVGKIFSFDPKTMKIATSKLGTYY